jgi:hypothetical protein
MSMEMQTSAEPAPEGDDPEASPRFAPAAVLALQLPRERCRGASGGGVGV